MTLTGALNDISGDGITGAVGLLSGDTGQIIIFGVAITILVFLLGVVYKVINMGKGSPGGR